MTLDKQTFARLALLSIIALMAFILSIWNVESLAFADYPNHLARFHILHNYDESEALRNFYVINDRISPYMGMGGFMRLFMPLLGVETAGRAFVILSLFLPVLGVAVLNWVVTKRISFLTLGAIIFVFGTMAGMGFLNFLFSTGIAFLLFSLWIYSADWSAKIRLPLISVLAIGLLFMHMIAAAFLGLLVGLWELMPLVFARKITKQDVKNFAAIAAVFTPCILIIVFSLSGNLGFAGFFHFGSSYARIKIFSDVFTAFGSIYEMLPGIAYLSLLFLMSRTNAIHYEKRLFWIGFILTAATIILPILFLNVWYFAHRFPFIGILLIIASIQDVNHKEIKSVFPIVVICIVAKVALVYLSMTKLDDQLFELRNDSKAIRKGAPVLIVFDVPNRSNSDYLPIQNYFNQMGYLIVDKDILFPYFFSIYEVGIRESYRAMTVPIGMPIKSEDLDTVRQYSYANNWRENFDYVVVLDFGSTVDPIAGTTLVKKGSWFSILSVD